MKCIRLYDVAKFEVSDGFKFIPALKRSGYYIAGAKFVDRYGNVVVYRKSKVKNEEGFKVFAWPHLVNDLVKKLEEA